MRRHARRPVAWALAAIALGCLGTPCQAQGPPSLPAPGYYNAPAPTFVPRRAGLLGRFRSGPSYVPGGNGPGFVPGLPRGRRYYGGRYFGDFNNRYYSPQYGYF